MRNFFKKIDETVREMWLGTFLWGCLCELVSVWWVKDRLYSGLGILIGMLLAMAGIWHMCWIQRWSSETTHRNMRRRRIFSGMLWF